eukprot:TRINITY_DN2963_c5_g1_i1.p1 TRINITY_DN2963_c5_g1~~TRINITY_DN2963_c5_g1_i1.p1  ORF type:complete len:507 (+),score=61.21 TRINITY_DN2963_c5_g1_i1:25-1521(+)
MTGIEYFVDGFDLDCPETYREEEAEDTSEDGVINGKRGYENPENETNAKRRKISPAADGFKPPSTVYRITDTDKVKQVGILEVLAFGKQVVEAEADTPVLCCSDYPAKPSKKSAQVASNCFTYDAVITPASYQELQHGVGPVSSPLYAIELLDLFKKSYSRSSDTFEYPASHPPSVRLRCFKDVLNHVVRNYTAYPAAHLDIPPNVWVLGDLHGSYKDLDRFLEKILPFGEVALCPEKILCLGDYVDRGKFGLETLMKLLALRALAPDTVYMLRGNHEDPEVCGQIPVYGSESLAAQCTEQFGSSNGKELFSLCCDLFTHLPLCATVDSKVFCVHGGVPRFWGAAVPGKDDRLAPLKNPAKRIKFPSLFGPRVEAILDGCQTKEEKTEAQRQWLLNFDLLWSDPVKGKTEPLDVYGFGRSDRDSTVASFSEKAVSTFLDNHGYDIMIRGHEEKAAGLKISQNSRVVTVFSSSNYQGHENAAGFVLIRKEGKIDLLVLE